MLTELKNIFLELRSMAAAALFLTTCLALNAPIARADDAAQNAEAKSDDAVATASIAPSSPVIPPGRPEWISVGAKTKPDDHWFAVSSGPFVTESEAERALVDEVKSKSDDYINTYLGSQHAANLLHYSGEQLMQRLVPSNNVYKETIQVSVGPMRQIHARIEFPEQFRHELKERWRQMTVGYRLGQLGLVSVVVLGLLTTAFGFFKANRAPTQPRGANLQFAAAAAILLIVVGGVTVAYKFLVWL